MKHRLLGNTGVKVSELCLGTSIYPQWMIERQNAGRVIPAQTQSENKSEEHGAVARL